MVDVSREYTRFDPDEGYPAARDLFYECVKCGVVIPSLPTDNVRCRCGNVTVDLDAGRLSVRNDTELRLYRLLPRPRKTLT